MRGCILEVNSEGLGDGVIDSMFVYHFVDFDLRVETFHAWKKCLKKNSYKFQENIFFLIVFFSDKKSF